MLTRCINGRIALSSIRSVTWVFLFSVLPTQAATLQYVSDELTIEFRAGRGSQDPVLRTLTSGTRVSLLRSGKDGHSRVRLDDGTEGWVPSHLLVKNAGPKQRLLQVQAKREELAAENQRRRRDQLALRNALAHLQSRLTAARAVQQQLVSTIARLRDLIPHRQALEERHRSLLSQLVTLERDLELLRVENRACRDNASQDWAMMGMGVLFGGVLAGVLVTRARW